MRHVCPSLRPSVFLSALNSSAITGWIFMKTYISIVFRAHVEKIQVSLKSDKKSGQFTWRSEYIFFVANLAQIFFEWKIFQTKVVVEIKTHIYFQNIFPENCGIYELKWKNSVQPGRTHMTIWPMRIACWLHKATKQLRICNIYCSPAATMVTRMLPIVTSYVNFLLVVNTGNITLSKVNNHIIKF